MSRSLACSGIWPATLVPFTPTGALDEAALAAHVSHVAGTEGVRAVVVNGHAGEVTSLDRDERRRVIEVAVAAAAPASVPVVAGVVADDARQAAVLARDAAQAGASGLLLFPPALFANGAGMRPEMARRFVGEVAQATDLPMVLFQLSRASGLAYDLDLLVRLCEEVPTVAAVKDGCEVPALYEDSVAALRSLPRPVAMLTSNNTWLLASLALGGDGILSGLGSVAAAPLAAMLAAVQAGDLAKARAVNAQLQPLVRAFYRAPYVDAHNRMKTALRWLGQLTHADPRAPLLPLDEPDALAIRRALQAAGMLPAA